jgi:hypothetical protein
MAEIVIPDPDERIPYQALTREQKGELHGWLTDHGIDYTRVPVWAQFDFDPATREWCIPVYWVDHEGRMRLDETGQDVRKHVVRRRELRPLPWPTYGPPRVWFNGVEIPGVRSVSFEPGGESNG